MICPECTGKLAVYCYPKTKVYVDKECNVEDSDQQEGYNWDYAELDRIARNNHEYELTDKERHGI